MDKKFKIFVIIAIVLLGIALAVSTFLVLNIINTEKAPTADNKETKSKTKIITIDLGEAITSNVYDEAGEQHIARVSISFGVNEASKQYKKFKKDYDASKVIIRNEIIQSIREQTYEMMSRTDAQTKLGDEIAERINKLLNTEVVVEVYFGDFFVQ
ncbi:flagellar basal body-associated FliL family protein [Cellulosilyticum sp. I15G10I2]|uniref:flagellar basal body-associated FliL family protein n=1 Tax=Cellulosilyticum sp. I15G10I2 TaxID=1892843 RepID=UPI00085C708E|nr:flagellar basal body-associated FliL family protein [Cellulosilyticum sp. I15G10I2]